MMTYPLGISALSWSRSESTVGLDDAGLVAPLVLAYPSVTVKNKTNKKGDFGKKEEV